MTIATTGIRMSSLLAIGVPVALTLPTTTFGQTSGAEAEESQQITRWYDPSDWFDDEGSPVYENEALDYDPAYGGDIWETSNWEDEIKITDADSPDYGYGIHYVWNEEDQRWSIEEGAYEEASSYKMSFDESEMRSAESSSGDEPLAGALSSTVEDENEGLPLKKISGEIEAFSEMNLRAPGGFDMKHSLARIQLANGKAAVIDLGYSSILLADISKGDQVTLYGNRGQLNDQNVFIATKLETADGETINMERAVTLSEGQKLTEVKRPSSQTGANSSDPNQMTSSSDETSQQDSMVLAGTVEDYQKKKLSTEDGERTFVKLRLESGEAATVDLGEETSLSDLDLSVGDKIRVEGVEKAVDDRRVLLAQSIKVAGEKVKQG